MLIQIHTDEFIFHFRYLKSETKPYLSHVSGTEYKFIKLNTNHQTKQMSN